MATACKDSSQEKMNGKLGRGQALYMTDGGSDGPDVATSGTLERLC